MSPTAIRLGLGSGGILFFALSVLVFLSGSNEELPYAILFFIVGVGFFVAIDYALASQPKPVRRLLDESELQALKEEEEAQLAAARQAKQAELAIAEEGDADSSPEEAEEAGPVDHMAMADTIRNKARKLTSEDEVIALINKAIGDMKMKGYPKKVMDAFHARLIANFNELAESLESPQTIKNKKKVLQFLAGKKG